MSGHGGEHGWETVDGKRRRVKVTRRNGRLRESQHPRGGSLNTSIRITWVQHDFLLRHGSGNISAAIRDAVDRMMAAEGA